MLVAAICLYMLLTVGIGLYASRRVSGAKDFMVAGRSLPLYMNFACVFATWFGAETVLAISATFTKDGLSGISGDPFGAAMCLTIVALFFARVFYRMDLLTIGDFYHKKYGKVVEVITSLAITISYLGWTSAQMTALGLVTYVLGNSDLTIDQLSANPHISLNTSILLGAIVVTLYTLFGGMWSVALTDLVQTAAIVIGLLIVAYFIGIQAGGITHVIQTASNDRKFQFFPTGGFKDWMIFVTAFLTFALGSIPQQDVFQRVTSAKSENTAVVGTLAGGVFYFFFAFVPMFIAYSAVVIDPSYRDLFASEDSREIQQILPHLILQKTPIWAQILFFGALLSAILSTASGALLAPSSLFTENVLQPFMTRLSDKVLLWSVRVVLLSFSLIATCIALNSTSTMYEMVQNAYKITMVAAFVPLAMGVFWKRSSTQGALCSIALGVATWLFFEWMIDWQSPKDSNSPYAIVPAQLCGLIGSFIGMVLGSLLPQWIPQAVVDEEKLATKPRSTIGH
jgi:solute:Na+ symporter, SSS family